MLNSTARKLSSGVTVTKEHPLCACERPVVRDCIIVGEWGMENIQSAVGHPFPTQQPFNHRQTLGTVPHYIWHINI